MIRDQQIWREYRTGVDRRKRKIPPLKYLLLGGRRRRIRRTGDESKLIILDTYSSVIFALAVIILVLSITDGLFSIKLNYIGAAEVNPFLSSVIKSNSFFYYLAKYSSTVIGIIILILLRNFRKKIFGMNTSKILPLIALFFIIVISYSLHRKFNLVVFGLKL